MKSCLMDCAGRAQRLGLEFNLQVAVCKNAKLKLELQTKKRCRVTLATAVQKKGTRGTAVLRLPTQSKELRQFLRLLGFQPIRHCFKDQRERDGPGVWMAKHSVAQSTRTSLTAEHV